MDVEEMVARSQDTATVGRVYGEPHEKDGTTVIPAAKISARGGSGAARGGGHSGGGGRGGAGRGGTGAGGGPGAARCGERWGGGFRADAEPVGAFVMRNGEVEWKPVFDLGGTVR